MTINIGIKRHNKINILRKMTNQIHLKRIMQDGKRMTRMRNKRESNFIHGDNTDIMNG